MQPSPPLVGRFHQTEGSWDTAYEAYCPGHGSPGHDSARSPGATVRGLWDKDAGWARIHPANGGPSGRREPDGASNVLHTIPHLL